MSEFTIRISKIKLIALGLILIGVIMVGGAAFSIWLEKPQNRDIDIKVIGSDPTPTPFAFMSQRVPEYFPSDLHLIDAWEIAVPGDNKWRELGVTIEPWTQFQMGFMRNTEGKVTFHVGPHEESFYEDVGDRIYEYNFCPDPRKTRYDRLFDRLISQYRKEWNDKMGEYKPYPLHDWTSHAADMLRYWAVTNFEPDMTFERSRELQATRERKQQNYAR